MTPQKSSADNFLYFIVLFCIFSFKIVLLGVGEGGIRPDDLLIVIAFAVLLFRAEFKRIPRSRSFNIYLLFVALNLFSAFWNTIAGRVSPVTSFLFVFRLLQYMIFYYLGYLLVENGHKILGALRVYVYLLIVVVPLQMSGYIPVPGAFMGITSRAVGNTNGPYELAAVAAFLLCFLGYQERSKLQGVVSIILMVMSASRITSAATLVSGARILVVRSKSKLKLAAVLVCLLLVGGIAYLLFPSFKTDTKVSKSTNLVDRISSLASSNLLDSASAVYEFAPLYHSSKEFLNGIFLDSSQNEASILVAEDSEQSAEIRLLKWASLIKSANNQTDSIVIGLGPSFGSIAVDGYLVRVFVESGIIGLALFLIFVFSLLFERRRSTWAFREYVFILLGTACFIDIFVSYKPMILLWLWHGMNQHRASDEAA
jgi:hypothetical protein